MSSAASITPTCRSAPTWASSPKWSTNGATPTWSASRAGEEAHQRMARLVGAEAARRRRRSTSARASRRCATTLPANTIICNGAGNFSGWWHRYWRYGRDADRSSRRPAARWAMACPPRSPPRCASRTAPVVCVAGDGDFLMNGQELATAAQYGADLLVILVDNGAYGTIRMHQEREYPERISATELSNPDFAALARAFGGWAETVETTDGFRARARPRRWSARASACSTARPTSSRSPTPPPSAPSARNSRQFRLRSACRRRRQS